MAVALATIIAVMAVAGASLAWLTAETTEVKNTFAIGNITIDLTETTSGYKVVPGATDAKDPKVTVKATSENCYVYVTVENNLVIENVVVGTPNIDSANWEKIETIGNKTLYRYIDIIDASDADVIVPVFTSVTYDGEAITSDNIASLKDETIVINAFAHQSENLGENPLTITDAAAREWAWPTTQG